MMEIYRFTCLWLVEKFRYVLFFNIFDEIDFIIYGKLTMYWEILFTNCDFVWLSWEKK